MRILVYHGSPESGLIEQVKLEFQPTVELRLDAESPKIVCRALTLENVLSRACTIRDSYSEVDVKGCTLTTKEIREPGSYHFKKGDVACLDVDGKTIKGDIRRWSDLCEVKIACKNSGLDIILKKDRCADLLLYHNALGFNMESDGNYLGSLNYDKWLWIAPNRPILVRSGGIVEVYESGKKTVFIEDISSTEKRQVTNTATVLLLPGSLLSSSSDISRGFYDMGSKALKVDYLLLK